MEDWKRKNSMLSGKKNKINVLRCSHKSWGWEALIKNHLYLSGTALEVKFGKIKTSFGFEHLSWAVASQPTLPILQKWYGYQIWATKAHIYIYMCVCVCDVNVLLRENVFFCSRMLLFIFIITIGDNNTTNNNIITTNERTALFQKYTDWEGAADLNYNSCYSPTVYAISALRKMPQSISCLGSSDNKIGLFLSSSVISYMVFHFYKNKVVGRFW